MKVLYFLRDNGGCGWYRCASPLETAAAHKGLETRHVEKGDRPDEIAEKIAWCEVIIAPRVFDEPFCAAIKSFKELGKKVVIDWDDNIFKISPLSPHYKDFGTEPYTYKHNGGDLEVWADGKNIDLAKNRAGLERAKAAMGVADMVTTTTEILAEEFRPFSKNVQVLPNCLDLSLWKKLPLRDHRGIRMGWTGGYSHYEDWLLLAPVLPEFMQKNPTVTLVILGQKFDGTLKDVDPKRIEYRGWCPTPAYPYVSATLDLDFAVIPLLDSAFNRCKSPLKWLEMAALQVPSVASFCSPYAEMMDLVGDNGIFVEANDPTGWYLGLNKMVKDTEKRKRMGISARQTVERYFDVEKECSRWAKAYESLLKPVLEAV